jgi:serine/threonine protein phosphatase PrpC
MYQKNLHLSLKPVPAAYGLTDPGCVRPRNEDAFYVDREAGLFVVADGLGGHNRGDIAAQMVVKLLPKNLTHQLESVCRNQPTTTYYAEALRLSLIELNRQIRQLGDQDDNLQDMGATVVAVLLVNEQAIIAHLGDSRAYLYRDGQLEKLTSDHSIVGLLVNRGEITPQEAENHPAKGRLTRYVGMMENVEPDIRIVDTRSGDRLLLCTDGLWGMLAESQLKAILAEDNAQEVTCRQLVEAGKRAGGQDNLTAVICDTGII